MLSWQPNVEQSRVADELLVISYNAVERDGVDLALTRHQGAVTIHAPVNNNCLARKWLTALSAASWNWLQIVYEGRAKGLSYFSGDR